MVQGHGAGPGQPALPVAAGGQHTPRRAEGTSPGGGAEPHRGRTGGLRPSWAPAHLSHPILSHPHPVIPCPSLSRHILSHYPIPLSHPIPSSHSHPIISHCNPLSHPLVPSYSITLSHHIPLHYPIISHLLIPSPYPIISHPLIPSYLIPLSHPHPIPSYPTSSHLFSRDAFFLLISTTATCDSTVSFCSWMLCRSKGETWVGTSGTVTWWQRPWRGPCRQPSSLSK